MTATTTAEVEHPRATPPPTEKALALAAELLGRSDLRLRGHVSRDAAAYALARALAAASPDSAHGRFLADSIRRRSKGELKRNRCRSNAARAARRLIENAQVPTEAAVAGEVRNAHAQQVADQERERRIAPLVEDHGGLVARFVADFRRRHQRGPSWRTVRLHMRHHWRQCDGDSIIRAMVTAGWLVDSGRPGSLALRPPRPRSHLMGGFDGPANRETAVLRDRSAKLPEAQFCTCTAGPFCRGAASADWASCSLTCRPCSLPAPRPVERSDPSSGER